MRARGGCVGAGDAPRPRRPPRCSSWAAASRRSGAMTPMCRRSPLRPRHGRRRRPPQRRARTASTRRGARAVRRSLRGAEGAQTYRRIYNRARRVDRRLGGARGAQLSAVIATLEQIARDRRLTHSRMPALFLQLRRNTEYWPSKPYPRLRRPRELPRQRDAVRVLPGPGAADPAARQLRQGQRDDLLLPRDLRRALRAGGRAQAAHRDVGDRGRPRRVHHVGVLLLLRRRQPALDQRHGAGHRHPGARARREPARRARLHRDGPPGARRLQGAGAARGSAPAGPNGGVALPPVLVLPRAVHPQRLRPDRDRPVRLLGAHAGRRPRTRSGAPATASCGARFRTTTSATGRSTRAGARSRPTSTTCSCATSCATSATASPPTVYCETAKRFTSYTRDPAELEFLGPARATKGEPTRIRFYVSKLSAVQLDVVRDGEVTYTKILTFRRGEGSFSWTPGGAGFVDVTPGLQGAAHRQGAEDQGVGRDRGPALAPTMGRWPLGPSSTRARAASERRAWPPPPRAAARTPGCARSSSRPTRRTRSPTRSRPSWAAIPRRSARTCSARRCRPRRRWSATGTACRSGSATCSPSAAWTASRRRS